MENRKDDINFIILSLGVHTYTHQSNLINCVQNMKRLRIVVESSIVVAIVI